MVLLTIDKFVKESRNKNSSFLSVCSGLKKKKKNFTHSFCLTYRRFFFRDCFWNFLARKKCLAFILNNPAPRMRYYNFSGLHWWRRPTRYFLVHISSTRVLARNSKVFETIQQLGIGISVSESKQISHFKIPFSF